MSPKLLQAQKEVPTYESTLKDISYRHKMLAFGFSENKEDDEEKLEEILSFFYDNFCEVVCEVPGNELRRAYSETELGFRIVQMALKKDSDEDQTADYAFKISVNGEALKRLKIRIERKELHDWNLTILKGWRRFKRELARSKDEDLRIVVEGNMLDALLLFRPYPEKCKYCKNIRFHNKLGKKEFYCKLENKPVHILGKCSKIDVKSRSDKKIAQLISFKRKRLGIIEAKRFPVVWAGTRFNAAKYINSSVKQFFIVNYVDILQL